MSVTSFKSSLEQKMLSIATETTGIASGFNPYIQTFDDYLWDVPLAQLPFWVGFALTTEREQIEIGSKYGNWIWHCQMYYLDTTQEGETRADGKARRDQLAGAITDAFEGNHFLADSSGPLIDTDSRGVVESVWQVDLSTVSFDDSGQEGYYTFVSEIFLDVHTNKN